MNRLPVYVLTGKPNELLPNSAAREFIAQGLEVVAVDVGGAFGEADPSVQTIGSLSRRAACQAHCLGTMSTGLLERGHVESLTYTVAASGFVHHHVLDPRFQAGRDPVEHQREAADDHTIDAGDEHGGTTVHDRRQLIDVGWSCRRQLGQQSRQGVDHLVGGVFDDLNCGGHNSNPRSPRRYDHARSATEIYGRRMEQAVLSTAARRLGSVLEPIAGQVYFSPECHANYAALGFEPSARTSDGVAMPDGSAYFTSRGSVMGQVPGEVVAAAFAVFNPQIVEPLVDLGWTRTDAVTICEARDDGAIAQLRRLLGDSPDGVDRAKELLARAVEPLRPEGRPLYAGMRSLALPESQLGAVWRMSDMLREYRGDSHTTSWVSAGFDATEIGLLTELYWGLPMRSYSRTRAWSDDQFTAAHERLRARGLVDETGFTDAGREAREDIEVRTDAQMSPAITALGDDIDELFAIMQPWGVAVRAGFGYLSTGPHDIARAAQQG